MRCDVAITFADHEGRADKSFLWYVTGSSLLTQVQSAATALAGGGTPPATPGTQAHPWVLTGYDSWLGAWQRLLTDDSLVNSDVYFQAGGRLVKKSRKGKDIGDGFYMSDVDYSGKDPVKGNMWNRGSGASYREYGRFMHDNQPLAPMEQVAWSRSIAGKLRKVLAGGKDYSGKAKTDVQSALPVLAVTMFLAEPARNPREWVIGQMMLDLIGSEYSPATATRGAKRYLMDVALAHPDRIDRSKTSRSAPTKPQLGPDRQRYHKDGDVRVDDRQGFAPVTSVNDLAKVEGKYPASPGGSAATSSAIDVAGDYIQKKEASIVSRWVASRLNEGVFNGLSSWSATSLKAGTPTTGRVDIKLVKWSASAIRKDCAAEVQTEITRLITARAASFGAM